MAAPMRVTGAWVQLLTDWLDRENLPAPDLRTVLDSRSPGDVVPMTLWGELLARAVALRPDAVAPALSIGAGVQPRHVGVLGYLILTCRTLGEALLTYQRYESLFYGRELVEVIAEGDSMAVCWRAEESAGALGDSVGIAALVSFLRRLVESSPSPTQVDFVFAEPDVAAREAYEQFFGCPVVFDQSHNRVVFPMQLLALPLPHSAPHMRSLLDRQARALLLALPDSDSFDRALQQVMVRLMPEAVVTLPRLARELHMSVRTLQRRLAERNMTWRALLDRTREQLARDYLSDPSLTLGDIALLLGFSEHSAFSRAWRQWTGTTPASARKQLRVTKNASDVTAR